MPGPAISPAAARAIGDVARHGRLPVRRLAGMDLVRDCPQPTLCWVFADRDGHIGMQASGWFPQRRRRHSGLVPVPAWDGAIIGEAATTASFCRASTIRRKDSSPRPTKTSTRRADRCSSRCRCPTIASGGSTSGWRALPQATRRRHAGAAVRRGQHAGPRPAARFPAALARRADARSGYRQWDCSYAPESREATLFQRFCIATCCWKSSGTRRGIGWRRMLYLVLAGGLFDDGASPRSIGCSSKTIRSGGAAATKAS